MFSEQFYASDTNKKGLLNYNYSSRLYLELILL